MQWCPLQSLVCLYLLFWYLGCTLYQILLWFKFGFLCHIKGLNYRNFRAKSCRNWMVIKLWIVTHVQHTCSSLYVYRSCITSGPSTFLLQDDIQLTSSTVGLRGPISQGPLCVLQWDKGAYCPALLCLPQSLSMYIITSTSGWWTGSGGQRVKTGENAEPQKRRRWGEKNKDVRIR